MKLNLLVEGKIHLFGRRGCGVPEEVKGHNKAFASLFDTRGVTYGKYFTILSFLLTADGTKKFQKREREYELHEITLKISRYRAVQFSVYKVYTACIFFLERI